MKILVLCEGTCEKTIIELLLDNNKLKITRDDLIGLEPYVLRQINKTIETVLFHNAKEIKIFRIGDTQKEKLKIPRELKNIVSIDRIFKYCTKPEIEILLLINEGLEKKFEKVKSNYKVSEYAKSNIIYNKNKYKKTKQFLEEYYGGQRINMLIENIKEYRRKKRKHEKDELYLAELLK